MSLSFQVLAVEPYYCSTCGNPYSAAGQQTYAQYAHNLAWGKNPVNLQFPLIDSGNNGQWEVEIKNRNGFPVTIRYTPSVYTFVLRSLGLGQGHIEALTLVLPDGQVTTVRVVYRPGTDYVIYASDGSSTNTRDAGVGASGRATNFVTNGLSGLHNFRGYFGRLREPIINTYSEGRSRRGRKSSTRRLHPVNYD